MKIYLTVEDIIKNNCLKNATLVARKKGIQNIANNIVVLETPDGMNWLQGNEIVLTAGYAFINDKDYKKQFIKDAYKTNAAALCIKVGRYYGEIDNEMIEEADELGVPIFILDKFANYTEIVSNFYELLFNVKNKNLLKINTAYYKLLNLQLEEATIEDIILEVKNLANLTVCYKRFLDPDVNYSDLPVIPISDTEDLGFLVIHSKKVLDDFQKSIINYAISLIKGQLLLEQDFLYSISKNNRMITQLMLSNNNLDENFYDSIRMNLGWNLSDYYGIYFKSEFEERNINSEIRKYIEYEWGNKFLFIPDSEGMIVYLPFNIDKLKDLLKKIDETFNARKLNVTMGISLLKSTFKDLNSAYTEAKRINKISKKRISYLEDFPGNKLILDLIELPHINIFINEYLGKIKDYDNKNNTMLLETLIKFVSNDMDRQKTSESMHIHIETLRYRLKRIEEITELELSKSKDLLCILLAIEIESHL